MSNSSTDNCKRSGFFIVPEVMGNCTYQTSCVTSWRLTGCTCSMSSTTPSVDSTSWLSLSDSLLCIILDVKSKLVHLFFNYPSQPTVILIECFREIEMYADDWH